MDIHLIMWIAFGAIVAVALFADLVILNKLQGHLTIKKALAMVCAWVGLALVFGAAVWLFLGPQKGLEFFTGYVLEYSLSIDNMFVFIMIFAYFAVPPQYQPKVLLWGILGAVIMRFIFIFVGVQLIVKFKFMIYVFGALLLYTAVKMLAQKQASMNPAEVPLVKLLKKIMPVKDTYHNGSFFVKENGKWFATPLFAALLVIEGSDLIFAVDSVPAVLSITYDTFIVYSSNIFAIIGLRSLYFLLAGMADKFKYLKYGIAVVLAFVGIKMMISHFFHIPTAVSLAVILTMLGVSIIASKLRCEA